MAWSRKWMKQQPTAPLRRNQEQSELARIISGPGRWTRDARSCWSWWTNGAEKDHSSKYRSPWVSLLITIASWRLKLFLSTWMLYTRTLLWVRVLNSVSLLLLTSNFHVDLHILQLCMKGSFLNLYMERVGTFSQQERITQLLMLSNTAIRSATVSQACRTILDLLLSE